LTKTSPLVLVGISSATNHTLAHVAVLGEEAGHAEYDLAEPVVHRLGFRTLHIVDHAAGYFREMDALKEVRHVRRLCDGQLGAEHPLDQVYVVNVA